MKRSRSLWVIAIALILSILLFSINAKVIESQVELSSDVCDIYLGKFSFSSTKQGQFAAVFKAELPENSPLQQRGRTLAVSLFRDEGWKKYLSLLKSGSLCTERMRDSFFSFHVTQLLEEWDPKDMLRTKVPLKGKQAIPRHGFMVQTLIPPQDQTQYVFAVLHDCMLENYKADPVTYKFTAVFLNAGSHLPADEDGMIIMHSILAILLGGYLVYIVHLIRRQRRDFASVHLVSILCAIALILQLTAVLCSIAHLIVYSYDGMGLRFRHTYLALDFLSKMCQAFSELIVAFVFLCLAGGWTLTDSFSMRRLASNPLSGLGIVTIMGVTFAMELIGRRYEDDFNKFHGHEHWPGTVLMGIRIFLALIFIATVTHVYGILLPRKISNWLTPCVFSSELTLLQWLVRVNNMGSAPVQLPTRVSLPPGADVNIGGGSVHGGNMGGESESEALSNRATEEKASFVEAEVASLMKRVSVIALVWFLTFPVTGLIISPLLPLTMRHSVVTWATLLAQSIALCYLLNSFLNPNSRAFKASSLRNMGTVFNVGGEAQFGSGSVLAKWLKASID